MKILKSNKEDTHRQADELYDGTGLNQHTKQIK
jgi:hypothetical protein